MSRGKDGDDISCTQVSCKDRLTIGEAQPVCWHYVQTLDKFDWKVPWCYLHRFPAYFVSESEPQKETHTK